MTEKKDLTAYWCTCATDPTKCLGCAVDKLVAQVLGPVGTAFLEHRTYKIIQPQQKEKK
jgi:hypothetical protein